ncbi:hypothetical protein K2Q16_02725 [Patescibacteria group bacterium]|nr:hypothetical protein [Patescibacteria group bacterium]
MSITRTSFSLLQATAATLAIAIILWSLGLTSFRFAEAANVTSFSDTLSDSAPALPSNHTLSFNTPNGVAAGGTIVVTFPAATFAGIAAIDFGDIDLTVNGTPVTLAAGPSGAVWGATTTATAITLTSGSGTIASSATVTIAIGTNATQGVTGDERITNPGVGSYEISLGVGTLDVGATRVAILSPVEVTASVETQLTFTVDGLGENESINGTSTTGSSTATSIPFGKLVPGVATTVAQQLSVETNASNGFVVTVQVDGQLVSATGADIDGFSNGAYTSTPTAWVAPTPSIGNEDTYGHWGITTNDNSITAGLSDPYLVNGIGNRYVSASTTPVEVFRHNGPADGSEPHMGQTQVGYQIQISALQEAGDDYNATLTYVATPVF